MLDLQLAPQDRVRYRLRRRTISGGYDHRLRLLCGSDKSGQERAINHARELAKSISKTRAFLEEKSLFARWTAE